MSPAIFRIVNYLRFTIYKKICMLQDAEKKSHNYRNSRVQKTNEKISKREKITP